MRLHPPSTGPGRLAIDEAPGLLRPGMRVYVQGGIGEPAPWREALIRQPAAARGIVWGGVLISGINEFDYAALDDTARYEGVFLLPAQAATAAQGRSVLVPMHYSASYRWVESTKFDLAVIHVSPPDRDGRCSFGVATDFAEAVVPRAGRILAYVNAQMPRTDGPAIAWRELDHVVELDRPLPVFGQDETLDAVSLAIGRNVASLVDNGDCLQMGVGKIPAAVLAALSGHSDLGLHSGLLSESAAELVRKGVVTGARKTRDRGKVVTGQVVGDARTYAFAAENGWLMRSVAYTHAFEVNSSIDNLVAINSALEIDLTGQANAEFVGGRQISGVGGAVDFARGAAAARGGRAVVALPSTAGRRSRIVARLSPGAPVTLARTDIGIVVTEHGVADLRGCSLPERARRLIAVADPSVRDTLERELRGER